MENYTKFGGSDSRMRKLIPLAFLTLLLIGCRSISIPKRAINDSGMMYAMVYDYDNTPVSGASVCIDRKKYIETDLQGRFILEFNKGEYAIQVAKQGYEIIEDKFTYDPMKVLYFKMINASQLLSQAENALDQYSYGEAEKLASRALALEPNRPDILYFQSVAYYRQGKMTEAIAILKGLQSREINGDFISEFLKRLTDR
jgi:tetratricopeptide (TPR) repeat protein